MSKIYTKKGDSMQTSLFDGTRVSKANDVIELIGLVDTMMAHLCIALQMTNHAFIKREGEVILSHLRPLMGELAGGPSYINQEHIDWLETLIDTMDLHLEPLNHFISFHHELDAAYINVWRTSIRSVERQFSRCDVMHPLVGMYLNRLSDVAFTMSRILLEARNEEIDYCHK